MAFSFANKIKKNAHGILCLSELKAEKHEFCMLSYDAKNACQELNSSKKVKVTHILMFSNLTRKKISLYQGIKSMHIQAPASLLYILHALFDFHVFEFSY
jgi:hypothetical protein